MVFDRDKLLAHLCAIAVDSLCRIDPDLSSAIDLSPRCCTAVSVRNRAVEPGNGFCRRQWVRTQFTSQCRSGRRAGANGLLQESFDSDCVPVGDVRIDLCLPPIWVDKGTL